MKALVLTFATLLLACLICPQPTQAVPEPSAVPTAWQLDVSYDKPMPIRIVDPQTGLEETYWFFRYQVVNRTGQDRIFVPRILLYTDTGQTVQAGKGIALSVVNKIKQEIRDSIARNMTAMTGRLLQGEDNSKRGIAVFRDFDPKAAKFDLFLGGLSGETATAQLPVEVTVTEMTATGELVEKQTREIVLSKTLRLQFNVAGNRKTREGLEAFLYSKDWVMR